MRQTHGPRDMGIRPTPGSRYPVLIGVTHAEGFGSVQVPYPDEDLLPGDHCLVVGSVGPNMVVNGDAYHGPYYSNNPTSGANPRPLFVVPGGAPLVESNWPDYKVSPPVTVPGYWSYPQGVQRFWVLRSFTGADDPECLITAPAGMPLQIYMIVVRGGVNVDPVLGPSSSFSKQSGSTGTPQFGLEVTGGGTIGRYTTDTVDYNLGWATDPGSEGNAHLVNFIANGTITSQQLMVGGIAIWTQTAVLYSTENDSPFPYPYFPDVVWTPTFTSTSNPLGGGIDPEPIPPEIVAEDVHGNKAWHWKGSYFPTFTVQIPNSPARTDHRWEYFGGALVDYIIDQTFAVKGWGSYFIPSATPVVVRRTGNLLDSAVRFHRLPKGLN